MTSALLFCLALWLAVGAIASWDLVRRGQRWWTAVWVLVGGVGGAVYWVAVRARSEIERVELADGPSDADAVEHDETDCEVVDRLMDLARSLTPTRDWTPLILEAGLDPADVVVTVMRRRLRRAAAVRAEHRSAGTSCENFGWLTVEENAAAAIAGLVGSFDDED